MKLHYYFTHFSSFSLGIQVSHILGEPINGFSDMYEHGEPSETYIHIGLT